MNAPAERAKSIFLNAVEFAASAERDAFVAAECAGDSALRGEVDELLRHHDGIGAYLESPAGGVPPTGDAPADATPLRSIGPYQLLQQIGEGGMGAVYMAEQTYPVRRKVALKLIKPGMDSRQVIARFEAERQALAMMDHVNIARVLDAGTTETGLPYFVMELVHGVPITKYCDDNHLTPRERLELFVPVCQAIQHAHQKGIIHRDIKPSNVMVTLYDGRPVPKVIDFGVAKATQQRLTERTMFTQYGGMVGTFEYMSPEQAEMSALGVDTRSDIYSLGVLLYELLTGSTPLTNKSLRDACLAEVVRMIREVDPPRPSTRLSDSGEALVSISAQRHMEPAKLTKLVRGELDWIVMKTLEKDRNRRYETASALAGDIQRYLANEPVQACPPSAGYRVRKFVRRNKAAVLAAMSFVLLLIGGIVATSWQAFRARDAEKLARDNELQALAQKDKAQANFALAKDAVDEYLNAVTDHPKLNEADFFSLRKELLETAVPFYSKFAQERSDEPEMEAARGRALKRLAHVRDMTGDKPAALADNLAMRDLFAKLAADHPAVTAYRSEWAASHNNIANLQAALGQKSEAEESYRSALRIKSQLAADFPDVPEHRRQLARSQCSFGVLLKNQNRHEESEAVLRNALKTQLALPPDFPSVRVYQYELAMTHNNLGILLKAMGRWADAEASHREAQKLYRQLIDQFPRVADYRQDLGMSLSNCANALSHLGQSENAETDHRAALEIRRRLTIDFPSVPEYRMDLSTSHHNLASTLADRGKRDEAVASYRSAIRIREELASEFPNVPGYRASAAFSHKNHGLLLAKMERPAEAEAAHRASLKFNEQLSIEFPNDPEYTLKVATDCYTLGRLARTGGELLAALDWYGRAIRVLEPYPDRQPPIGDARRVLRNAHHGRAIALDDLQRYGEAAQDWDKAHGLDDGPRTNEFRLERDRSRILHFLTQPSPWQALWGWPLF